MSDNLIVLLGSIGLAVIVLLWTFASWSRTHSARTLMRGVGAIIAIAGLWILGLMLMDLHGIRAVIDWAETTTRTNKIVIGLAVLAVGVLFWLIGSLIRPVPADVAKQRRLERRETKRTSLAAGTGSKTPTARTANTPAPAKPTKPAATSDEDAEVEAILKARGIE